MSEAVGGGMGHVAVTLNGRTYRMRCDDGQEQRLFALADHVRAKVDGLVREFGQVGEDRLLLMAALLVADEVFDLRQTLTSGDEPRAQDARLQRLAKPARKIDPGDPLPGDNRQPVADRKASIA